MTQIIATAIANSLKRAVEQFRSEVEMPAADRWKTMSDGELWLSVLGQIAVVGGANSGDALKRKIGGQSDSWFSELMQCSVAARHEEIHRRLREAGVRYVTAHIADCRKSTAASQNFDLLCIYGGPKTYFQHLASVPIESWRIGIVSDELAYIKNKGARDLLIGLGLVRDAIAFDTRLMSVLTKLGANLPSDLTSNKLKYKSLERELLEKVCQPCSISGGHLDRILFNRWKQVA